MELSELSGYNYGGNVYTLVYCQLAELYMNMLHVLFYGIFVCYLSFEHLKTGKMKLKCTCLYILRMIYMTPIESRYNENNIYVKLWMTLF